MEINHVEGVNKGDVMLYALSTCAWCKKTKALLNSMNVEYSYIDVDLLKGEERDKVIEDLKKWNPRCSFPTLVINNDTSVVGYKEDEIREVLS
ncbi:MAG: glutaredoxin family protein [Theionarchaea archaeon]|nr:glutaredoxin family protein [Theionarchaea archaeon]